MFARPGIHREEEIINGAILSMDYSFGHINQAIRHNALFIADNTIIYPSGRNLATLDLSNRRMDFIKRDD